MLYNRDNVVRFDLARLMRAHKVTIRELARRMGNTQKQIRACRAKTRVSYCTYADYTEAVTGVCVFNRGRYDAIVAQLAKEVPPIRWCDIPTPSLTAK